MEERWLGRPGVLERPWLWLTWQRELVGGKISVVQWGSPGTQKNLGWGGVGQVKISVQDEIATSEVSRLHVCDGPLMTVRGP